ncbi:hypothetical protein E4T56_gene11715 [Termitomyces sp. T112]|nr:hypothetical protein E4T56_gene11715 [Termitomyces sp. T112]
MPLECLPLISTPPPLTALAIAPVAPITLWPWIPCPTLLEAYNNTHSKNEIALPNVDHSKMKEPQLSPLDIQTPTLELASLVFFIKKKDSSLQLIQNYWVLDTMTVKNHYSLPLISKLINNLWGAWYFTKLDVQWGYNNVCIYEEDKWKATFWTNQGLFEPLIMFFRLTDSLATFQTMMNNIF